MEDGSNFPMIMMPHEVLGQIILSQFPRRRLHLVQNYKDLVTSCLVCSTFRHVVETYVVKQVEHISPHILTRLKLGEKILNFSGMRKLDISDLPNKMRLRFIEFPHIQSLKVEDIGNSVPIKDLDKMTNLSSLIVYAGYIDGDSLAKLSGLTKLYFCSYKSRTNLKCLKYMSKLTNLSLWTNNIISNSDISELSNLTVLDIYRCRQLTDDCLPGLISLTNLAVSDSSGITENGMSMLTSLTRLRIDLNVENTCREFLHLTRLKSLELCPGNQPTISTYLEDMTQLEELDVNLDLFVNEDKGSMLRKLTNLTKLYINNGIESHTFQTLTLLKKLWIHDNFHYREQPVLANLKNLHTLDIRSTDISSDVIKNLTSITKLYAHKDITYDTYASFPNLRTLKINSDIKSELSNKPITSLTNLTFSCNDFLEIYHFEGLTLLRKLKIGDCYYITPMQKPLREYLDIRYIDYKWGGFYV